MRMQRKSGSLAAAAVRGLTRRLRAEIAAHVAHARRHGKSYRTIAAWFGPRRVWPEETRPLSAGVALLASLEPPPDDPSKRDESQDERTPEREREVTGTRPFPVPWRTPSQDQSGTYPTPIQSPPERQLRTRPYPMID
jgi:hypothetical protein